MKINLENISNKKLDKPFTYNNYIVKEDETKNKKDLFETIQNKAWLVAKSPLNNIFMNLFLFYMIGNSLHIYSIFMLFQLLSSPINSLLNIEKTFSQLKHPKLNLSYYKMIFTLINCGMLVLIGYKLYNMGLLPLSPADYIDHIPKYKEQYSFRFIK